MIHQKQGRIEHGDWCYRAGVALLVATYEGGLPLGAELLVATYS